MTMGATKPTLFKLKCPGHIIMTRKILAIHSTCGLIGFLFSKTQTGIYGLYSYNDILFENGIEWDNVSMSEVDTSTLDGKCITALLMGAIRADRFSEGALLYFFETGTITKWLNRLKEIDEKKES